MVCSWSYLWQDVIKKHNLDNYAVYLWLGGSDDYLCNLPNMCSTCKSIQSYLQQDSGLKFSELLWAKKTYLYLHMGQRLQWELSSCLIPENLHDEFL